MARLTLFVVACFPLVAMLLWHSSSDSAADNTAQGVALMRRLAYLIGGSKYSVDDPASICFLSWPMRLGLQYPQTAQVIAWAADLKAPGALGNVVTRSKHYEAVLEEAVGREGALQVVVIGAGYTTYGHRLHTLLERKVPVFELDLPAIQEKKRTLIEACQANGLLQANPRVRYVAVDLGTEDPTPALKVAGFDPTQPAVYIWEGVTMYVPEAGVRDTLTRMRSIATNGSILAFTYLTSEVIPSHPRFAPQACESKGVGSGIEMLSAAKKKGEPWVFGVGSCVSGTGNRELADLISKHGWTLHENLAPAEMWKRYLGADFRESFGWKLANIGNEAVVIAA